MVSIKDVAKNAGVSAATVSRVLAKRGNVKEETELAVLQSIEKLNYMPNILAQQLRQQKTNAINVIVPDITNPFFFEIVRGIERVARQNNYQVYIVDADNDSQIERHAIAALTQKQVDGMISLSATSAIKTVEQIAKGFPMVIACQYFKESSLPNIGIDNIQASKDAVNYMISLGHRDMIYLTTSPNHALYRDRLTGYMRAMEENGLPIDLQKVAYAEDHSMMSGYKITKELLQFRTFTGICAAGDGLALGAMKAIQEAGLKVPEDISIVGFDDTIYAQFSTPSLTTIHQPMAEIGEQSMHLLLDLINGKETQSKTILKHTLVLRNSVKSIS